MSSTSRSLRTSFDLVRVLVLGTAIGAALAIGAPSSAHAWDPINPGGCSGTIIPTPANLNICEQLVLDVIAPDITDYLEDCSCDAEDLINPFTGKVWCLGHPECAITGCGLFPHCLAGTNPLVRAVGYAYHYDELTCDFTGLTPDQLVEHIALEGFDVVSTAVLAAQTGGASLVFYDAAEIYLDVLECNYTIPLPSALKAVMRVARDDSPFEKETTFFDADLDDVRLMKESDFPGGIPMDGMTLGHIIIVTDEAFEVLRNWSYDIAYVKDGKLCPNERFALELIMHESVHVRQYRNLSKRDFIQRYLADTLVSGYSGAAYEEQAYELGLQGGFVGGYLEGFEPVNGDLNCLPFVPPTPPGTVATTPAAGGAPAVTIVSMCGTFGPLDCVPHPIECDGAHAAQVTLVGTAMDPDGISSSEWRLLEGTTSTTIATGDVATLSFASRDATHTGFYNVGYQATDNDSPKRTAAVSSPMIVHDTLLPTVTFNSAPSTYECHVDTYVEAGGSATDVCDPAVSAVSISGTVDTLVTGSYDVTYSASDDSSNVGNATRTVTVVDTLRPTIDAPAEIVTQDRTPNLGTPTATDLCTTPTVFNDAPAIFPYGTTVVTWWSRDAAGNQSLPDTQTVTVLGGDASSAGRDFSCDLSRDGEVFCWGADDAGQLGDGANVDRWGPRAIDMTSLARQVSVGARHACAVKADGSVQCWGSGQDGRLGNGSTLDRNVPFSVSSLTGAVQVSAGGQVQLFVDDGHSCAVLGTGAVKCWGENGQGQLGDTTSTDRSSPVTTQLPVGTSALQVTAGGAHSCAVDSIGRAFCWGAGANGRLGNGATSDRTLPVQVSFQLGVQAVQIDAGERHTCAVDQLGSVWCWGSGANGRLGNNSLQDKPAPVKVTLPASAVQVSAGVAHTCALLTTGRVFCWGSPLSGRLGDGSVIFDQLVPLQSAGITNAVQVSAGNDHSCARLFDGSALRDVCWGDNSRGELGDGTSVARATQVQISTLCEQTGFFPPSAGAAASCIIGRGASNPQTAMCWGSNGFGQLGEGTGASRRAPTPVVGTSDSPLAAAGGFHGCALTATGGVQCWGTNLFGQLGDGTLIPRQTAAPISGGGTYAFVATGANHSCGIVGGQVKCWGANTNGQIGDGTILPRLVPTLVTGLPGQAMYLDLGDRHSCAVVQNGTNREVWCWGGNLHGQLGNGFLLDSWLPVRAGTIANAWMVSAGANHTCATTTSGPVFCWGQSLLGQVGNSVVFFDAWSPQQVVDNANAPLSAPFAFVSAGGSHSCVAPVGPMQQAACWGNNLLGQLGNGNILPNPRAQTVAGLAFVSSVSAGDNHTCARVSSTSTVCWGDNSTGQLGDGTLVNRATPVRTVGACY